MNNKNKILAVMCKVMWKVIMLILIINLNKINILFNITM